MRKPSLTTVLLAAGALALLPFASDAQQAECCNATTSVGASINSPVAGDETFFKLPTGPSNVMFLLDTSGSMSNFPQCGDYNWDQSGSSLATCTSPNLAVPAPSKSGSAQTIHGVVMPSKYTTFYGTCTPNTSGYTTASSSLAWMEAVVPSNTYADNGYGVNALPLSDCPPWGNGPGCGTHVCSGTGCLFQPAAYYLYNSWSPTGGGGPGNYYPYATPIPTANGPCIAVDGSGNVIKDASTGSAVNLGAACTTCMANHGFYIYTISYYPTTSSSNYTTVTQPIFKGSFLNVNPPKFVTARQVVKSIAWMDPANPRDLDQIRLGLTVLNQNSSSIQQGRLIVPLGPDMGGSYPPTQLGFRQARQYLLSVINDDATKYTDSGGNVICDGTTTGASGFQNGLFNPATNGTPLGSVLFNIGQYFTYYNSSQTTENLYPNLFGATGCKTPGGSSSSCMSSKFYQTAAGDVNAAWVTNASNTQCSICWGCQASAVVIVTDGSPNDEIGFPGLIKTYDSAAYSAVANCDSTGTCAAESASSGCGGAFKCNEPNDSLAAGVPRVAAWMHNTAATGELAPQGLRYDLVLAGGESALTVDTIGVNVANQNAINILTAIANMGGGIFQNAFNAAALTTAVYNAVSRVTPRNISSSAPSINALQTVQTTSSQAFITTFRPSSTEIWEGHVYEAFLFNEFLEGCVPGATSQPTVSCGQTTVKSIPANFFSGTNLCTGIFLIDLDCDEVVQDPTTGNYLKKGQAASANLPWDAGQVINYQTFPGPPTTFGSGANPNYLSADETAANARNIFTWIGGSKVAFTAANAATIEPYLNISTTWCNNLLTQLGITSAELTTLGVSSTLECAKQIIYFVRGWDVLNQGNNNCGGPDNPANTAACQRGTKGEERDRAIDNNSTPFLWKLGDIFHSSPALVQIPIDETDCATGYENQCTWAIYSPPGTSSVQTPMAPGCTNNDDCYQQYRNSWLGRERAVLVGSNDGMLHAFDAGAATGAPDITGNYQYTNGTGKELWAFVPPDLLPQLQNLLSAHTYMVDSSVMVRDIWVDGTSATNGSTTPSFALGSDGFTLAAADGYKQPGEFHTVAIFGRRSGGNQYSALDVTNIMSPTYLWNWPQGCSDDTRYMGESWVDFSPRPPPIGPVKLATAGSTPDPLHRGFEERWVVMVGGGYDPTLTLGRAVFFIDAWTGQTLWRFTDDDFKSNMNFSGGSAPSMFPVPGGVGPLDIGDTTKPTLDADGYFDTASWGDMGGNLFVARFWNPGVVNTATGRVTNWYAGRAFEELRATNDAQYVSSGSAGRNEFFTMPSNAFEPSTHTLHTYIGSGNREQLMQEGSACGTDNLLACCQEGCSSVTATASENYGACARTDTFTCSGGVLGHTDSNTCSTSGATCAAAPGNAYSGSVNLTWVCPTSSGSTTTTASGSVSCTSAGVCTVTPVTSTTIPPGNLTPPTHNRFYGVLSYGGATTKMFSDQPSAKTFDQNRSTDVPYAGTCGGVACSLVNTTPAQVTFNTSTPQLSSTTCANGATKCWATTGDPGWYYEYGDYCPLQSCPTPAPWTDEKTPSGSNVVLGCVGWSGFRPVGITTSTNPCQGNQGAPTVYNYSANYIAGTPSGSCNGSTSAGTAYIAAQQSVTAAPNGAMTMVTTQNGEVNYSSVVANSGAPITGNSAGTRSTSGSAIYWLEVPPQLHQCRHVTGLQKNVSCN